MNLEPYKEGATSKLWFGPFILKRRDKQLIDYRIRLAFWLPLIFFAFLISPQVYAVQTLTLEQCISLALKNNDSLHVSLSDLELHRQETKISHSELFPKLKSNFQYSMFDRAPSFVVEKNTFAPGVPLSNAELPAGKRDVYAFTLSVEQPLFTGGYLTGRYMRNIMQGKASEMGTENTRNETILKVKLAYYDVLKAFKLKEIHQQSLKFKEEHKRVVEEYQKGGLTNREELLLVESDLSTQRLELFKAENAIKIKDKVLKNLIGINLEEEIVLDDELENKRLVIGLSESKDIALKNRKDLAELFYMIKGAEREIGIAKSNFYPKTSLIGSYTRQRETPLTNPDLWTLMLTLDWDIFQWGKTKADVKRAKAKHKKLNRKYSSLEKNVMLDVEENWFKVKEAKQQVNVSENSLIHAEEYYKNAVLKYKEDILKTAELLEAETYLIQKKNEYINSIYDLNKALAEFEFLISADITPLIIKETIYQSSIEVIEMDRIRPAPAVDTETTNKTIIQIPSESGQIQTVKDTEVEEKVDNRTKSPEHEEAVYLKQLPTKTDIVRSEEYFIQVGAFKYAKNAQELLKKLKIYYPETHIVVANNFNKVRISGVKTKEQGALIIKDIKKKFKLKPILVLTGN